ncbi:MAG: DNA mismatch repair protein MutS [Spirochaetaceae bacterium]|jgi:DNA mismatch repair protein MutS|nr:DNA mismatch repair protein MutS [Spirochaetaceae bacterium]
MLEQYRRIKREHQGEVVFFRLGDFYEMFSEDAIEVSALLNITLTSRNGLPMCGVPYHSVRSYIARLLKHGKKIAICEQITEAAKGKTLIDRQVVEVITPGTTVDEYYLDKGSPNYLASLATDGGNALSFAYIDLSTGDFHVTAFPKDEGVEHLRQDLERLQIRELILQESLLEDCGPLEGALGDRPGLVMNRWADWLFDPERSRKRLEKQFGTSNLKGFGLMEGMPEIIAAGALLYYLDDTAKTLIPHVRAIRVYRDTEYVGIDEATQRNLEILKNVRDGDVKFSLFEVLDETRTSMGRRLLKRRILHPLRNLELIHKRLDLVETLYQDQRRLGSFREFLGRSPDLERLCSRLAMDRAHGKDMLAIKNALVLFQAIRAMEEELIAAGMPLSFEAEEAASLDAAGLRQLMELRDLLETGLAEDPSILLTEGNLIREGYSSKLDGLRRLKDDGRQLLEAYLEEERERTGIPSLKIRYNRLIGYFFEVTKAQLAKVPAHFIRRQGVATGERFTTDRLGELESGINGASEQVIELEKKLFLELRDTAKASLGVLAAAGRRMAELDLAQSLARAATIRGWIRPVVDEENRLEILEGRHPVVEAHVPNGEFIPNDILLDGNGVSFALITGPNMAGKSTYLRQAAVLTIMAQMGSFIPAREARIGMVDRIYCRVGASDNLARGESTFLVEMNETAYILHTATEQSLVIMDEVGRGTGTNDGLAIAWAVSEELLNHLKCRTLFATHFHELSRIVHPRMANRSMEVLDQGGEIIFLRKLKEGPAAESYGLHVARLAGLSERVLYRAACILERLEESGRALQEVLPQDAGDQALPAEPGTPSQSGEASLSARLLAELTELDPDRISPLEALHLLHTWKQWLTGALAPRNPAKGRRTVSPEHGPSLFESW